MALNKEQMRDFVVGNDKLHVDILIDVNKLKETVKGVLDNGEKLNTKNEENFKNILIELVKLEARLEFMNAGTFKGLQK